MTAIYGGLATGSVGLFANSETGAIADRMRYDEYGQVLEDTNPGFQPFGYAGGLYDPDTGLVRFGARDYDPEIGRWLAKDPIRFEGKQNNFYAYVENDPINYADPNGKVTWWVAGGVFLGLGIAWDVGKEWYDGRQDNDLDGIPASLDPEDNLDYDHDSDGTDDKDDRDFEGFCRIYSGHPDCERVFPKPPKPPKQCPE